MENMMRIYAFCAFWMGAIIGSFINAAAMRTVSEKKWWGSERSVCDSCGRVLTSPDLIPVISYIVLGGRCRSCKAKIPIRHIAAEVVLGVFAAFFFLRFGFSYELLFASLMLPFLLFHALTDIECGYIYDSWAIAMAVTAAVLRLTGGLSAVIDGALGAALGFGFIMIIILVSRGGMGFGDAMLMMGVGSFLGWKMTVAALYFGFISGGIVVIPLLILKKVSRKDSVPLGPFLALGAAAAMAGGAYALGKFGIAVPWPWFL